MPGRSLLFVAILILAGTIPFLIGEIQPGWSPSGAVPGDESTATRLAGFDAGTTDGAKRPLPLPQPYSTDPARTQLARNQQFLAGAAVPSTELRGLPGVSLADALRFDVTPAWVSSTWPHVTPQRMETGWYGLRVPLVTGTDTADVAGSLTYYFNAQNYVERITLYGFTDDAEPLISLVQQNYSLRPFAAVGRGLWLSFHQEVPIGMLRIDDAMLRSGGHGGRYRIDLELNLPREGATLRQESLQPLRRLRDAKLL
jgi:hypothetical protein